jgi:hypothetical protein
MPERLTDERLREMNQYQQHWDYGRAVTELIELRKENKRLKKGYQLYNHEPCPVCGEVAHQTPLFFGEQGNA